MNSTTSPSSYRWQLWIAGIVFIVSVIGFFLTLPTVEQHSDSILDFMVCPESGQPLSDASAPQPAIPLNSL
ncbi:MAG: hypothetical protein ACFB10_25365 [Salibacteraceae bacterium]